MSVFGSVFGSTGSGATAAEIVTAIWTHAATTPLPVDVLEINGEPYASSGLGLFIVNWVNLGGVTTAEITPGAITAASIAASALNGKGDWLLGATFTTFRSAYTDARAGYMDKLNVAGTLAHTGNAADFKADVSGLVTSAAAIQAKTDQLTFTTPNSVDATASVTLTQQNIDDIADGVAAQVEGGLTAEQSAHLDAIHKLAQT